MSLKRRWSATCDHPECTAVWAPDESTPPPSSRMEIGRELNDSGWQASPAAPETYCPDHWIDDKELMAEAVARREEYLASITEAPIGF